MSDDEDVIRRPRHIRVGSRERNRDRDKAQRARHAARGRGGSGTIMVDVENYEDELVDNRPSSTGRARSHESKFSRRTPTESKRDTGSSGRRPTSREDQIRQEELDSYRRAGTPPRGSHSRESKFRDTSGDRERDARRNKRRTARGGDYKSLDSLSPSGTSPRASRDRVRNFDESITPRELSVDSSRPNSREQSASREGDRGHNGKLRSRSIVQKRARDAMSAERELEYERNRQEQLERITLEREKTPTKQVRVAGDMELDDFENFRAYVRELVLEKGVSNRREVMVDCVDFVGRKLKAHESDFLTAFLKKHNNKAWSFNGKGEAKTRSSAGSGGDSDSDSDEIYMIPSLKSEYMDSNSRSGSRDGSRGEGKESEEHQAGTESKVGEEGESKQTDDDDGEGNNGKDGSDNNKIEARRSRPENMAELVECLASNRHVRREFLTRPLPSKLGQLQAYVERVNNDHYLFFVDDERNGDPAHKEHRTVILEAVRRRAFNKPLVFFFNDFGAGSPNEPIPATPEELDALNVANEAAEAAAAAKEAAAVAAAAASGREHIVYNGKEFPYVGKLRSNFGRNGFVLFDNGGNPRDLVGDREGERPRSEQLVIGFKRQMTIGRSPKSIQLLVPAIDEAEDEDGQPGPSGASVMGPEPLICRPLTKTDGLKRWQTELPDCVSTFVNKNPEYNKELKKYLLSFGGRITKASVKNFQLIQKTGPTSLSSEITLQFGRRQAKDIFALDFRYPLSPLQAFAVAVSISLN
eukprot:INCI14676.1.p1 GENE.INCI14676.1~~INCI14676.1.p1  ORF type:complete len:755 (-),score=138.94 INCI14676.1:100-2364(-)